MGEEYIGDKGYYSIMTRYMFDRYNDLKEYCESNDKETVKDLLGKFDYREGSDQDYSELYKKTQIQSLYTLRYMYAYAYEYREMYRYLLREHKPKIIKVLSVGCGNGVDYWSLRDAFMKECKPDIGGMAEKIYIDYVGLDAIDWQWRWGKKYLYKSWGKEFSVENELKPRNGNVVGLDYKVGGAGEFFNDKENAKLPYNTIIFPKSISEFSDTEFDEICEAISKAEFMYPSLKRQGKEFYTDKIHVLVSLRTSGVVETEDLDTWNELKNWTDNNRCNRLAEIFTDKGYSLADQKLTGGSEMYISECDEYKDFGYPPQILKFVKRLESQGIISKVPILTASYICNRIMTFERSK